MVVKSKDGSNDLIAQQQNQVDTSPKFSYRRVLLYIAKPFIWLGKKIYEAVIAVKNLFSRNTKVARDNSTTNQVTNSAAKQSTDTIDSRILDSSGDVCNQVSTQNTTNEKHKLDNPIKLPDQIETSPVTDVSSKPPIEINITPQTLDSGTISDNDNTKYDLDRFVNAQNKTESYNHNSQAKKQLSYHETALAELKAGKKKSHWIWFIFPQLKGLGTSSNAIKYGLNGVEEAIEYLNNEKLALRLITCTKAIASHNDRSIKEILVMGGDDIDYKKFKSSMAVFSDAITKMKQIGNIPAHLSEDESIFAQVLQKMKNEESTQ